MFQGYISLDIPPPAILTRVSKAPDIQRMLREKSTAINTDGRSITRNALIRAISETFDLGIAFKSGKWHRQSGNKQKPSLKPSMLQQRGPFRR